MADLVEFYQDDSDENSDDGYGYDGGFEIQDLTPLQRMERYLESDNMFNRQMLAKGLLETLRGVHDQGDDCLAVLESMAKLSEDPEPSVRSELMEQVPHIAVYCQENRDVFASSVPQYILPMVVRYLNDSNGQVRKTSQAALLVLMEQSLVEKMDVEMQVVQVILDLAAPESSDDYRSEAAALMSKMAPLLGRSITERHFLSRFSEMCTDPLFHVRKVCAANFGEVSSVVGVKNCEEVLLPKFFCLCEDAVWGVRKACAECFMTVSCACSLETRRNELANLFVNLLCDQSRWVRMSAFQNLGPFISTFASADETGFYVDENGSFTDQTLESFSIEEYEAIQKEGVEDKDLQGILQLKSLDSPNSPTEDSQSTLVSGDVSESQKDEPMVLVDDDDTEEDLEANEFSVEELRASSLSENQGGGDSIKHGSNIQECNKGLSVDNISVCDNELEVSSLGQGDTSSDNSVEYSEAAADNDDAIVQGDVDAEGVAAGQLSHSDDQSSNSSNCDLSPPSSTSTVITEVIDNIPDQTNPPVSVDNTFNNFLYWRSPIPDVNIDMDLISSKPTDFHAVSKCEEEANESLSSAEFDANVSCSFYSHSSAEASKESNEISYSSPTSSSFTIGGVSALHTASVSTMHDSTEETMNIGSTHVLGQRFGERHYALVDGVVQDLSGSNIGFMDDLPSLLDMVLDDTTLAQQQNIVPQLLLENYLGMVDPSRAQTVDGDITRHCAYNLPAVAYTLGRRNWHCIKQLFETLAQDMQWKVRRTLAYSIHELAWIVGDEITHKDLVPIFDGFLKDLDEVRIGVLKHLADIFKLLRPNIRLLYLGRVHDFMKTDNTRNWRYREELAEQLVRICDLFECKEIVSHVVPLALVLCMDKVAQVRTMALRLLSSILRKTYFDDEKKLLASICNDLIEQFATNNRWLGRQTFALLCYVILEEDSLPPEVFARNLLPSLLALSMDPVANVRLCLARVLSERITPLDYFTSQSNPYHSDLVETLQKLTGDSDKDVRYFSSQQQPKTDVSQHHPTVPV